MSNITYYELKDAPTFMILEFFGPEFIELLEIIYRKLWLFF